MGGTREEGNIRVACVCSQLSVSQIGLLLIVLGPAVTNAACTAGPGAYCITASSPPDPCPEGYFCLGGATDKRQCWPGTYSDTKGATSNSTCRDCKSGKFSGSWAAASNASCSDCIQGKYSGSGATECSSCPAGAYSETIGAASIATCRPCAALAGNFCPSAFQGPVTGTTCPPGHYCEGGTSDKVPCPQGKRSPALGASSIATCSACSAGWSSNPGDAQCSPCDLGRYSESSGGNCTQCPPGKYSDVQGAENCKLCDRGKYSGATGGVSSNSCQDCLIVPPGFFCDAGSAAQSGSECLAGYQCVGGQIIECIGGSFSRAGASECTLCAAGTYSELKKATRCNDCPGRLLPLKESFKRALTACVSHVLKNAQTRCNDCAEGTY